MRTATHPFLRFLPHVRPYLGQHLVALGAGLATAGLGLAIPWLLATALDGLAAGRTEVLLGLVPALLALAAGRALAGWVQRRSSAAAAARLLRDLKVGLFGRLLGAELSFFETHHSADLVSRSQSDLAVLHRLAGDGLRTAVWALVSLAGATALMARISPPLALLACLAAPPVALAAAWAGRRMREQGRRLVDAWRRQATLLDETSGQAAFVRQWTLEARQSARWADWTEQAREDTERLAGTQAALSGAQETLALAGVILLMAAAAAWYGPVGGAVGGAAGGAAGSVSLPGVGRLVALALYARLAYQALGTLAGLWAQLQNGRSAAERYWAVMDAPQTPRPGIRAAGASATPLRLHGAIALEKLSFGYPGRPPVLCGADWSVEPGQVVCVRGPSGAGKTTLVRLLTRLYAPTEGRVLYDGRDLAGLDPVALRARVGVASQETAVLDGSLEDNLVLALPPGAPAPDADGLRAVLAEVRLDGLLAGLPQGLATPLGEAGWTLSRGERQRLALARLLLREPDVLILDEATASLDPDTERQILEVVWRRWAGRTVLVIAHDALPLPTGARTVRLEGGRIVEEAVR